MNMTWNQLKELVDKAIKEAGKTGDIEIDYFDFTSPCADHDMCLPEAFVNKHGMLEVH